MSFRCIKAFMHAFSGRFSRTCLEGISFNFFVCFIFNVSLGSAPKRKNFDIQRNTRVGSGGQFTSNRLSNDHTILESFHLVYRLKQVFFSHSMFQRLPNTCLHYLLFSKYWAVLLKNYCANQALILLNAHHSYLIC